MKKAIGKINVLYPTPVVLVGVLVGHKPNFLTVSHIGPLNHAIPRLVSVSMAKIHYSNRGVSEHNAFSINIPAQEMVCETDYCGMVSGAKIDKAELFELFYGELKGAPMIQQCPLNMACRLYDVYDLPTHDVFIGEIVQTYADEGVLTEGAVDLGKVKPLLFDMNRRRYWSIGESIAACWQAGKDLFKQRKSSSS